MECDGGPLPEGYAGHKGANAASVVSVEIRRIPVFNNLKVW